MKKFLAILSFFSVVCFVIAPAALPLRAHVGNEEETPFQIKSNGKIVAADKEFESFGEYLKSDYFKKSGKRCGVRHASPPGGLDYAMAAQTDCSLSGTVIQNEYWPAQAYIVPVVFHIIHKTDGTGNISDLRIYDQLEVLNDDYRALSGTLGELGYDTKIQFELAGITRTENNDWFNDNNEYTFKNTLGWDRDEYLNIYINSAGGYLGYAYLPQTSAGSVYDGVVVLYQAVGGRDNGFFSYDQGRTLVHEVGHYLGLLHTFDGYGCYEGYNAGDLVSDTLSENTDHYGCTHTYSCGTADDIHNYMNYTDDPCMYQFTSEQANRMVCSLVNYRPQLAVAAASLTLTSPNGGESWSPGIVKNITWDASGISANLKITLWKDGSLVGVIANSITCAPGTHAWTVGQYVGGTALPGTGYTVKVKEKGVAVADVSDAIFSISKLTLTSPNGGESWQIGSSRDVTWDAPGVSETIKVTLWKNGVFLGVIVSGIAPGTGTYSWTVGRYIGGTAAAGTGYVLKIKEKGTTVSDFVDGPFELTL